MTIWAGYYQRSGPTGLSDQLVRGLSRALSRRAEDKPIVAKFDWAGFVYVETHALAGESTYLTDRAFSLVAGEPFVNGASGDRPGDIRLLNLAWSNGEFHTTARAAGVFAAAHYDRE